MAFTDFKGKKIFLQIDTIDGIRVYQGLCSDVIYMGKGLDDVQVFYFEIVDIKGEKVGFSSSQIKLIQEEK